MRIDEEICLIMTPASIILSCSRNRLRIFRNNYWYVFHRIYLQKCVTGNNRSGKVWTTKKPRGHRHQKSTLKGESFVNLSSIYVHYLICMTSNIVNETHVDYFRIQEN
jgi:hypothetical protein